MDKFNELRNRDDLADFLNISHKWLNYILYAKGVDNCYSTFEIPKKSGGTREISAPSYELKIIQKKLSLKLQEYQKNLWKKRKISPNISHAFERDKSIITNAFIHRNKRYVLNIDLENFFDTIHFGRVSGFFQKHHDFNLPYKVATIIAQLSCYKGALPQGAPSSPVIANMICQSLDIRVLSIAKKYKLDYTRYADDLTFSTNYKNFLKNKDNFLNDIKTEIKRAGFKINEKKTRLLFRDSRQEVTGLVVNKKINVPKKFIKDTRAMAYRLYTTGEFMINDQKGTLEQLEGRFSFIDQLDKYNNKIDTINRHNMFNLNSREREYKKFLFFKYFFSNEKPLIITEGKTDIRYIKAALKNKYVSYPDLIERKKDGSFIFKISFFKRTKRWKYFFDMSVDGADAMKKLYEGLTNKFSYMPYFEEITNKLAQKPIIFIFDNETETDRPLKKFLSTAKVSDDDKNLLQKRLYIPLNKNIFLVTNPLKQDKKESEIEDLFPEEVLSHKIKGKKFTKNDKYDFKKYYGKNDFSNYIMKNYKKINFTNFRRLLNAIEQIQKNTSKNE